MDAGATSPPVVSRQQHVMATKTKSPRPRPSPLPGVVPPGEERTEFWRASGQRTLAELLEPTVPVVVDAPAKNVILFVGDGMGVSTVTAARIYGAQRKNGTPGEESRLAFERFPFTALIKVVLGGGLSYFWSKDTKAEERHGTPDLIRQWEKAGRRRQFVSSKQELLTVDANKVDNLLGLFSPSHLPPDINRTDEVPSLTEMVVAALKMLRRKGPRFALIVEGGMIDQYHHVNHAVMALSETVAMSDAIEAALKLIDYRETLFLVTADHSHGFTMNGYPPRGHPILGQAGVSNIDGLPYTTLMYNTGPSKSERQFDVKTEADDYRQVRNVPIKYAVHGGEDVALYAMGPMAHLVRGVLEQHVVGHIIHYAACLGDGTDLRSRCNERKP